MDFGRIPEDVARMFGRRYFGAELGYRNSYPKGLYRQRGQKSLKQVDVAMQAKI